MTVPNQNPVKEYIASGTTVGPFATDFLIQSVDDLQVFLDGQRQTSGYSVSGIGNSAGANVTFGIAPAAGVKVLLKRYIPLERVLYDYQTNGDLLAGTVNSDFDRIWLALQDVGFYVGNGDPSASRALLLGDGDVNGSGSYRALQNKIQDVADPTNTQDAVNLRTLQQALADFVTIPGGDRVLELLANPSDVTLGVSLVGAAGRVVSSIADLRTLKKTANPAAFVTSYRNDSSGGGGSYRLDLTDTTSADNGGTIIVAADGGRWKLMQHGPVSARQFGIRGVGDEAAQVSAFFSVARDLFWDGALQVTVNSQIQIPRSGFTLNAEPGSKITAGATMQSIFLAVDKNNVAISGLEFDLANKTQMGVYFRASTVNAFGLTVERCIFRNASTDPTLQVGPVCVDATGGAAGTFKPSRIRVFRNQFYNCLTHGCLIAYADSVEFSHNYIDTVSNHGMEAVQCTNVQMMWNTVRNCTLSGLGVGSLCQKWNISNNLIDNCGGDGSITVEHNCVHGSVHDNVVTNCRTTGINFSYGTGGSSPFDKIQRVTIHDNYFQASPGVTTFAGMNIYSATGPSVGAAIHVHNNTFTGFNGGLTAAYLRDCTFTSNIVTDLTGSATFLAKLTYVTRCEFSGWRCDSTCTDSAIQLLDYTTNTCDRVSVNRNYVASAVGVSLVVIAGTGIHQVFGNGTGSAVHFVTATGSASYQVGGNWGNLAGTPYSGGTSTSW